MTIKPDDIKIEELAENHRELAKTIGIEALLHLCEEYGGTQIYIPTVKELARQAIYKMIKREYVESDISLGALARKYGVSESTVYRLVRKTLFKAH